MTRTFSIIALFGIATLAAGQHLAPQSAWTPTGPAPVAVSDY